MTPRENEHWLFLVSVVLWIAVLLMLVRMGGQNGLSFAGNRVLLQFGNRARRVGLAAERARRWIVTAGKVMDVLLIVVVICALSWLGYHLWLAANGLRPPSWP